MPRMIVNSKLELAERRDWFLEKGYHCATTVFSDGDMVKVRMEKENGDVQIIEVEDAIDISEDFTLSSESLPLSLD